MKNYNLLVILIANRLSGNNEIIYNAFDLTHTDILMACAILNKSPER